MKALPLPAVQVLAIGSPHGFIDVRGDTALLLPVVLVLFLSDSCPAVRTSVPRRRGSKNDGSFGWEDSLTGASAKRCLALLAAFEGSCNTVPSTPRPYLETKTLAANRGPVPRRRAVMLTAALRFLDCDRKKR